MNARLARRATGCESVFGEDAVFTSHGPRYENEDIQLSRTGLDTFARIISAEHHTGIVFAL
jgi:hypothetical protein